MRREDFILTELEALGNDIERVVASERERIVAAEQKAKDFVEAHQRDKAVPVLAEPYIRNLMKPELEYFMSRLRAASAYLADESQRSQFTPSVM